MSDLSSRDRGPTPCRTTTPIATCSHLAAQLCRDGSTPVHFYMQYNQNVTAEVLALVHKINPEAVTGTDK